MNTITHKKNLNLLKIASISFAIASSASAQTERCPIGIGGPGDTDLIICSPRFDVRNLALDPNSITRNASTLTLTGSHHRTLIDHAAGRKGLVTWATGDFAQFDEYSANQEAAEIGFSHDFGIEHMRFGFAIGYSNMDQDLPFGGNNDSDGNFVFAEADYAVPGSAIVLSAAAYYGEWDLNIDRAYPFGGGVGVSRGTTDADTFALRLRADWVDYTTISGFSITPRIAYTLIHTSSDAYAEAGGPIPATFNSQSNTDHEIRVGIDADYKVSDNTDLRTIVEVVKRWNDDATSSGLVGITPFNFNLDDPKSFWGRIGVELVHNFTDTQQVSVALFGSTEGSDPTVSGAISFSMDF